MSFVNLFTGLPGAGKTAHLVSEIERLKREEPHRPIYAMGINGLKEGVALPLTMEELENWWEELPTGSIIAIDEAQEDHLMPLDYGKTKPWVKKIAKVRHYGMTFMLTTQDPKNMSAFVRRLVTEHVDIVDKFGTGMVTKRKWGRCMDDPDSSTAIKAAVETTGTRDKSVFDLYVSSQLHTRKMRIPRKVWIFLALVVIGISAAVSVPILVKRAHSASQASVASKDASMSVGGLEADRRSGDRDDADSRLRHDDYAKWMSPRVPGQPWTAPAFDKLEVQAQPRVFCVANENGDCHCRTEQGTKYQVEANLCRAMVDEGGPYNPFLPNPDLIRGRGQEGAQDRSGGRPEAVQALPVASASRWSAGVAPGAYTPPELTTVSAISSSSSRN